MRRACIYEMHSIKLGCLLCADGLMLVGYSKIGYRYLFLPPACIRGPAFICPYRPCPRLLSEARPLIESRSLFEDLRYTPAINTHTALHTPKIYTQTALHTPLIYTHTRTTPHTQHYHTPMIYTLTHTHLIPYTRDSQTHTHTHTATHTQHYHTPMIYTLTHTHTITYTYNSHTHTDTHTHTHRYTPMIYTLSYAPIQPSSVQYSRITWSLFSTSRRGKHTHTHTDMLKHTHR